MHSKSKKEDSKDYSEGSKDIHRIQRVLDERSNEGINQRKGYKQSSNLKGKISNNKASTT